MNKKYRCFALFSGGLDSVLSVLFMQKLGYEVIPVYFQTPFFPAQKAKMIAEKNNLSLQIFDITENYLKMLKNPRYGFGKNFNPCIDCHGLMFEIAGKLMEEYEIDFLISGEVLGQRPMSQRLDAINAVGKLSKVKDLLVRPLCQKLLPDTKPLRVGWVKKSEMLDIQGRGRNRQLELAKEFGITDYQTPGGGCLLTDLGYSRRLKDLINNDMMERKFIEFLSIGRHFRLSKYAKLIVGRNKEDNIKMSELASDEIVLHTKTIPGPLGVFNTKKTIDNKILKLAGSLLLRYNNKVNENALIYFGKNHELNENIFCEKMLSEEVKKYLI